MKKTKQNKRGADASFGYKAENMVRLTRAQELELGLPAPGDLAKKLKLTQVTINLEDGDVRFFKAQATKYKISYQGLIREVVSHYAHRMAA
jgi:predicted DNA binding CopG/RHH family protein